MVHINSTKKTKINYAGIFFFIFISVLTLGVEYYVMHSLWGFSIPYSFFACVASFIIMQFIFLQFFPFAVIMFEDGLILITFLRNITIKKENIRWICYWGNKGRTAYFIPKENWKKRLWFGINAKNFDFKYVIKSSGSLPVLSEKITLYIPGFYHSQKIFDEIYETLKLEPAPTEV